MEIELIDGLGRLVRGGGKVVKNAAGFDIPKLMVGSYGRLGVLLEATLKVFPKPPAWVTVRFEFSGLQATLRALQLLQANPLPISALEIEPPLRLVVRFAGRAEALPAVVQRAQRLMNLSANIQEGGPLESTYWQQLSEFAFLPADSQLIRVAMSGRKLLAFHEDLQRVSGVQVVRYSGGCSVAWLVVSSQFDAVALHRVLLAQRLAAVVVCEGEISKGGNTSSRHGLQLMGDTNWVSLSQRLQHAMDPHGKFADYAGTVPTEKTLAKTETADAS